MHAIPDDFMVAAKMLGEAQMKADKARNANWKRGEQKVKLKIDGRKLSCAAWIALAEDSYTKAWLVDYFDTDKFKSRFTATFV